MTLLPEREPKAPGMRDRSVPIARTAISAERLRRRFGVTRVGETTLLDRTGIPNYCAIVPRSCDVLGVYNGKGPTPQEARVSAIMEALERQVAANVALETHRRELADVLVKLDLTPLGPLQQDPSEMVECVDGIDLLSGENVPVPLALVRFPWRGKRLLKRSSTNGLASGNTLAEAIYHALTEMIERHLWSLYVVRCEVLPRYYRGDGASDIARARVLRLPTGDPAIDALVDRIRATGLTLRVTMLEQEPFVPAALACVVEPDSAPPMAHIGLGASLSAAHAIERALNEVVQSRVVDVQAAREDILRADENGENSHAKRITELPKGRWYVDLDAPSVKLSEMPELLTDDIIEDIGILTRQMASAGVTQCVVVPLVQEQGLSVVRICAPRFETLAVDGRIGPIALAELNPLAPI